MYGINERVYRNLINYFKCNIDVKTVILFGSRAKKNEKYNSDIDLCIECSQNRRGTIEYEIDEIIGVYSCDILFLDSLNDEIKKQIDRDGIIIYKKEMWSR